MGKFKLTPDQKKVIHNKDGTLVVSAAAGSGKTAVLIERVVEKLLDETNPVRADHLLIVTFTRAATAEIRSRLEKEIHEKLKENPNNKHLQTQQMLLPSAHIYTIDAFCSKLVRENFNAIENLSPDFKMLDEAEAEVLMSEALETIIEDLYEENTDSFKNLVELLFVGRDDSSLEENIKKLYTYSRAYPFPNEWLKEALSQYDSSIALKDSEIGKIVQRNTLEMLEYYEQNFEKCISEFEVAFSENSALKSIEILKEDCEIVKTLIGHINDFNFDSFLKVIPELSRWVSPSGYADNERVIYAKDLRNSFKDDFKKITRFIASDEKTHKEDADLLLPMAEKLIDAVTRFDNEYLKLKIEHNAYDFSDIELFALKLLIESADGNNFVRTELATDISNQFDEILIDEYQDTNKAQDMIFKAISKNEENLFMVGDVKQSIYGFRQAMPEIFLEKKETIKNTVILGKNFRSREGILNYINFIFERIMTKNCGDVDYKKNEQLVYGATDYKPSNEEDVEFHLLNTKTLEEEGEFIAKYITDTVASGKADYKDFTILMQTQKNRAPIIEKALRTHGIPVYLDAAAGFFDTADVQIITSFLRVINNPLQDIPLLSVLMSPIFGFSADEVSILRLNSKNTSIYAALLKAEKNNTESSARNKGIKNPKLEIGNKNIKLNNDKVKYFLETLRKYRRLSVSLPAADLIRTIYDDTLFPWIAAAMPNGKQRIANLNKLVELAKKYDTYSTYGLSGFVRHIDRLIESGSDTSPAQIIFEADNVVRIMSIHKSKGLQFKYCILADTTKNINKMDERANLILHPKFGIGIKGRHLKTGHTYPTLIHTAFKLESNKKNMSEVIRTLYVALTRAKEKLIIIASVEDIEKEIAKAKSTSIHPYIVRKSASIFNLLMPSTIDYPNTNILHVHNTDTEKTEFEDKILTTDKDEALIKEIEERLKFEYPYKALSEVTTKRAASHVNDGGFSKLFFASAKPEFKSKDGFTPAERGVCLHKFMQYADFTNSPTDELNRLKAHKFLTETEAKAIDLQKVQNYIDSNIAGRIKASKKIMREKKFSVLVPASNFYPELSKSLGQEKILIQGIADLIFIEEDGFVILDYKTDRTKDKEKLINKHKPQLETYKEALEQVLELPMKEAYIYAFSLDEEIKVL
ncbi:MAG: UvrD-helicase domain-containing protein [Ruminococcaceae bacterium]|nr:UvrD-helicase domain-containing protein [Oscillospiraceae bacterium]